jgi:hypothetical protein
MRTANLVLRLLVELACLAALAFWGAGATGSTPADILLAILAPLAAATAWGIWSAPRAAHRLAGRRLTAFELSMLAVSCALLAVAGAPLLAIALAVVAVANGVFLARTAPEAAIERP